MEIRTSEACIQTYYSTLLDDLGGSDRCKDGAIYAKHGAICLEAQRHANAEAGKGVPSRLIKPGEEYHQLTLHRFYVAQ
jgi:aldose 1-epimerase